VAVLAMLRPPMLRLLLLSATSLPLLMRMRMLVLVLVLLLVLGLVLLLVMLLVLRRWCCQYSALHVQAPSYGNRYRASWYLKRCSSHHRKLHTPYLESWNFERGFPAYCQHKMCRALTCFLQGWLLVSRRCQ
jgi:hypothetical protein